MLRSRVIPCLLIQNGGLVKTIKFGQPKYIGDPLNAVRIFNEKEADELMVLDIDATVHGCDPNYRIIKNIAAECRMPLCYGGGISTVEQFKKIIGLGVEKVAISTVAVENPEIISQAAKVVGSQSVVVILDAKKKRFSSKYSVFTHNGTKPTKLIVDEYARKIESLGAGEIVINSIDNDGVMEGYDHALIEQVRTVVSVPVTVLGGAGSLDHIRVLVNKFGLVGASAGSLFVFKGKFRAVLISYPSRTERDSLVGRNEKD